MNGKDAFDKTISIMLHNNSSSFLHNIIIIFNFSHMCFGCLHTPKRIWTIKLIVILKGLMYFLLTKIDNETFFTIHYNYYLI